MKRIITFTIVACLLLGAWFVYSEIYTATSSEAERVQFQVKQGESVAALAERLDDEKVIRSPLFFKRVVSWRGIDRDIKFGSYEVTAPITLHKVITALAKATSVERTVTIIPGWNLRDIAAYFEREGIATVAETYALTGEPAVPGSQGTISWEDTIPRVIDENAARKGRNYEGYFAPDTYRVFEDATAEDILKRLVQERNSQFSDQMYKDLNGRSVQDIIVLASILEREVRTEQDRKMVADIFWRRLEMGWALQADSTVHYLTGKAGNVFTSAADRQIDSPWNTYKYPRLPEGPISNPSLSSIMAAIYPEENEYWYFLTTLDTGEVKYGRTLEEHNANVATYLR